MSKEKAKLTKKAETAEIEGKKMAIKISKFHSEHAKAEKFLKSMMNKHAWIETEKDAFGIAGGDYDFEETNPEEMSRHLKGLQAEQTSLVSIHCMPCNNLLTSASLTPHHLNINLLLHRQRKLTRR